jgi:pimeloyl-ACP methyl ester carboxylesterase
MATYILVHGGNMSADTWNRLTGRHDYPEGTSLGSRYWDGTSSYLESRGPQVFTPSLDDEHDHNLSDHIKQVCDLILGHNLRGVILAGHSYGGMVITGAADRVPGRIRHMVYIDAVLPIPGESLFDIIRKGGRDPLSFPGLESAAAYVEEIRFEPLNLRGIGKTYIRCTESEFSMVTCVARDRVESSCTDWDYQEWPTSHVPMATMPGRLNWLLAGIAER